MKIIFINLFVSMYLIFTMQVWALERVELQENNSGISLSNEAFVRVQTARTCKDVRSCEEAVILWCNGYKRADADKDGIPCENVCKTKAEVDRIREKIGC